MKPTKRLQSLVDEGLIDEVLRQLMSGKEAAVYVVRCGDETRCAKVYKEATQRSFRQAVDYTENRTVRNTRQARAMAKRSRYGRQSVEEAWRSAEVDALYRLAAAGVRVPRPFNYADGVLLMELVADEHGAAAPRLNDVQLTAEQARELHAMLVREVVRMLVAGVVHGDLSEFNVLLARTALSSSICRKPWTRLETTTRAGCCCATWRTCETSLAASRPICSVRTTVRRSGICMFAENCAPKRPSLGSSSGHRPRSISQPSCERSMTRLPRRTSDAGGYRFPLDQLLATATARGSLQGRR